MSSVTTLPLWRFREWLSMSELAAYLHKPSGEAARRWALRHQVPMAKVGREWRADRRDVDRIVASQTRRALQAS